MLFYETSAKININIDIAFKEIIDKVLKRKEFFEQIDSQNMMSGL